MVFTEDKKIKILQFILNNVKSEDIDLFMNSLAIRYLNLKETNKDCEEYKKLKSLFDSLNRYPRINDNKEIYWVRSKKPKAKEINNEYKNNFFKIKNNKILRKSNEKDLIKDIFFDFKKELEEFIFYF